MDDKSIVALFWNRNEQAIEAAAEKYGSYCRTIALRILENTFDAEECVNDTYKAAWDSIPPNKPAILSTYLGKLTRRISLKVLRARDTQKRGNNEVALSIEELHECVPDSFSLSDEIEFKELVHSINTFLSQLPISERRVFILRYWHGYPIAEICERFGYSKSKVESMLHRTRSKLKKQLMKEGYFI